MAGIIIAALLASGAPDTQVSLEERMDAVRSKIDTACQETEDGGDPDECNNLRARLRDLRVRARAQQIAKQGGQNNEYEDKSSRNFTPQQNLKFYKTQANALCQPASQGGNAAACKVVKSKAERAEAEVAKETAAENVRSKRQQQHLADEGDNAKNGEGGSQVIEGWDADHIKSCLGDPNFCVTNQYCGNLLQQYNLSCKSPSNSCHSEGLNRGISNAEN